MTIAPPPPGLPGPTLPVFPVLDLIAAGLLDGIPDLLRGADPGDPFVRLARADVRMRGLVAGVVEIQDLRDELRATLDPWDPLLPWAEAVLAEQLVLHADLQAFAVAAAALVGLDDVPLPPLPALFGRARLRRVAAWSWIWSPAPEAWAEHRARRDAAIADFSRCGFITEVAFTRGATAGLHAMVNVEQVPEAYEILLDAQSMMPAGGRSMASVALDAFLVWVAWDLGLLDLAADAAHRVRRLAPVGSSLARAAQIALALLRVSGGAGDVGALDGLLAEHARDSPTTTHSVYAMAADVLADAGHPAAGRIGRLGLDHPDGGRVTIETRELLRLRTALAGGQLPGSGAAAPGPGTATEAVVPLRRLTAEGRSRVAGRQALRLAADLADRGLADDARRLEEEALSLLPPPALRTGADEAAVARLARARARFGPADPRPARPTGSPAAVSIRVLAPLLEVEVAGEPRPLGPAPAKLLLGLVLAHPSPLHVEMAHELLWPDEALPDTRARLNTLVHRLRRALGGPPSPLLRRDDLLLLDEAAVVVDLVDFRRALKGSGDIPGVLASVRGNLCEAQFPYDEHFAAARHSFTAEWLGQARPAVADGGVTSRQLADAATALGIDPDDLLH